MSRRTLFRRLANRTSLPVSAICALVSACDAPTHGGETAPSDELAITDAAFGLVRAPVRVTLDPSQRALDNLRNTSRTPAEVQMVDGYPRNVRGRWSSPYTHQVDAARNFLLSHEGLYRPQRDGISLHVLRMLPNGGGVAFYQTWRGLPLFGAELTVLMDGTQILGTVGSLAVSAPNVDTRPGLAPEHAIERLTPHA
ncbi:MAG TPA: hypothetical protein PK095_12540, partial [Myxococcota bacterium]|nr:hypothetical protein [Myxococcota bacterium]